MTLSDAEVHRPPASRAEYRWTPRVVLQLAVLALAAYIYAVAEMAPIGAMPAIAHDLGVGEARVGMLMASYAFISVLATVPLVRWTATWPRRRTFVLTLACLTISQVLSVIAPGLALLAISRVLCALTHGLMWSIIAPIGARLVPASHVGRATTAVYTGTAAALIVGNPVTTSLSSAWGWRPTVALVAVLAAVVTALAQVILPPLDGPVPEPECPVDAPPAVSPWRNPALLWLCVVTLIGVTAHFVSYTYIVPIVRDVIGLDGAGQAGLLAAYGVAGLLALALGARAIDRRPSQAIARTLGTLCVGLSLLVVVALLGHTAAAVVVGVLAIVLWGGAAAAVPPMLQSVAMRSSRGDAEQGSAFYVTAFQVGIMAGSMLGGVVLSDRGIVAVVVVSAALFAMCLGVDIARDQKFRDDCVAPPR